MNAQEDKPPVDQYVLAIDLGSGGPKVGIVDLNGCILASAAGSAPVYFLPEGGAEQVPAEWWSSVSNASKQVIRESGVPPESILAISVTSQWAVIVPVDENGEELMNAVSWMDTRGGPYNREIIKGFPSLQGYGLGKLFKWLRVAGNAPTRSGVDALGHILFIRHERPDIYRKTYKFLEPMDFINLRLTGKCAATQNTVFPYVMTHNRKLNVQEYDPWLLKVSGVEKDKLPDLHPIEAILGPVLPSVAADWGVSPEAVVIAAANDNNTSAIGSGAIRDFDPVAVMGTSGYLSCHVPFKKSDVTHLIGAMPSTIPDRYLIFAELGNTGKVLDAYLNNFVCRDDPFSPGCARPEDLYARVEQVAEQQPPGSGGVLFLPWFNGTLSPSEDQYMRGGFLNLSHHSTREQMTRAVLEGIAFNWRWLRDPVEKFIGRKFECWRLGGGGALSGVWAQIMADVVGIPMYQLENPRMGNVLGAAFLGFNRLGLLSLQDIPEKIKVARVYEPRAETRPIYDKLYQQFLACYQKIKPVYHALNK
jgi:xylulokinase